MMFTEEPQASYRNQDDSHKGAYNYTKIVKAFFYIRLCIFSSLQSLKVYLCRVTISCMKQHYRTYN